MSFGNCASVAFFKKYLQPLLTVTICPCLFVPALTPEESKDDDLFSEDLSKKASKPAVTDAAAKTPVLVQSSKVGTLNVQK